MLEYSPDEPPLMTEAESDAKFNAWEQAVDSGRDALAMLLGFPVDPDSPLEDALSAAFEAGFKAGAAFKAPEPPTPWPSSGRRSASEASPYRTVRTSDAPDRAALSEGPPGRSERLS